MLLTVSKARCCYCGLLLYVAVGAVPKKFKIKARSVTVMLPYA